MENFFSLLSGGGALLLDPMIWFLVLLGTAYGIVTGAMPGIGATLAFGLILPVTFVLSPVQAVALLLSISVGVSYGNSIPAIMIGVPGTPAAILTVLDGFALHKRGETGLAVGVAYVAAIVGQLVSIPIFVLALVPLSGLAYVFLAPELFGLYLVGVVAVVSLTGKNVVKGLTAAAFGLAVGLVGLDPIQFQPRYDFGFSILRTGFDSAAVVIGLLALSELFRSGRQVFQWGALVGNFRMKFPSAKTLLPTVRPIMLGTVLGTAVGAVPGASGTAAAMIAYQQAKLTSKRPEEFGKGSTEGIAANESAQNAANSGELIPTLGLGIPGSGSMVLLLSALTVQGLVPGPRMVVDSPDLVEAAVGGMLASTVLLIITGWWLARAMLKVVTINRSVVIVVAIALVVIGTYSLHGRVFDVITALVCGVIGYFMRRYGYSVAAAALAVVLAEGFEKNLRGGLALYDNNVWSFVSRPMTAALLLLALAMLIFGIRGERRMRRVTRALEREAEAEAARNREASVTTVEHDQSSQAPTDSDARDPDRPTH
jgi:putative tricarboxylic transport membrane protein